jgi:hypothetical protein
VRPILRFFAAAFLTANNPGLMLPSHKFIVAGRDFPLFIMIGLLLLLLATLAHQQPFNFVLSKESVFPRYKEKRRSLTPLSSLNFFTSLSLSVEEFLIKGRH